MISKIKTTAYLVILCLVTFLLPGLSVSAQETNAEVAARLAPPLITSMNIPDEIRGGLTYTLTWTVLGYHSGYKTLIAFFDCTGQTNCGGNLTGEYTHSGKLDPISSETGDWEYEGVTSTLFNYSYDFIAPDVDESTDIIIRLYQINDDDNGVLAMFSLTVSPEIAVEHGNSGRRISNRIVPNPGNIPDTSQITSYTDTSGDDADYPRNPQSFTDNGDGTVTDNNTFLMWQQEDDHERRNWGPANTYCTNLSLGGYNDWRLPTAKELVSIVNYGNANPAIDTTYFPKTGAWAHYEMVNNPNYATSTESRDDWSFFIVQFSNGAVSYTSYHGLKLFSRCVRSDRESTLWSFDLVDNSDGTVSHGNTELMWQQEVTDDIKWEDAISYCENLDLAGFNDWKLPNIKELQTILDYEKKGPTTWWIDEKYFPDTPSFSPYDDNYVSSTTDASDPSRAWGIPLYQQFGTLTVANKTDNSSVMCVRRTHWADKYQFN